MSSSRELTMIEALNEALREEMERDPTIIILGEDVEIGIFGVTSGLKDKFGADRVRNTPISENTFVGAGVGAALAGYRPVVELMFLDFMMCAMDQLVNNAAKMKYASGGQLKVPVVYRLMVGLGRGLGSEHAQACLSMFMGIPGLKCVVPSTPYDAKGLLKTALRNDSPVVFFEQFLIYRVKGPVPVTDYTIPFGKADIKKSGKDVTVVAIGAMVPRALTAARKLESEGIDVEVVDLRTLIPLDKEAILKSVEKTGRLVTVEPGTLTCGVGAEIAAIVAEQAFNCMKAPIVRLATPDVPAPVAPPLEKLYIPDEDRIVSAVKKVVSSK